MYNLVTPPETWSLHRHSGTAVNFAIQCQCLSTTTGVVADLDAAPAVEPAVENPEPPHNSPPAPALDPEPVPALGTVDAEVLTLLAISVIFYFSHLRLIPVFVS